METVLEWLLSGEVVNFEISLETLVLAYFIWVIHKRMTIIENELMSLRNHLDSRDTKLDILIERIIRVEELKNGALGS